MRNALLLYVAFFFFGLNKATSQVTNWHYDYTLFSSDGSKKVFGPHFTIKIRKNMEWADGERAHIIKKFYDATDAFIPTLILQSRSIDESTSIKKLLRGMTPKSWKLIAIKDAINIDQCEAGYVENEVFIDAESSPEMKDVRRFLRTYAIRYKKGVVFLMFIISKFDHPAEKFSEDDLKHYRKYFHEMAISTIVTSRWRKDN